jgi:hypothetical protein
VVDARRESGELESRDIIGISVGAVSASAHHEALL